MVKLSKYFFIIFLFLGNFAAAENTDPNDYFKERKWSLKWKDHAVELKSEYIEEPVSKPNLLKAEIICNKTKKRENLLNDFKFCGLDSVTIIGDQLVMNLADYDPNDPSGYCKIKRQEKVGISKNLCSDVKKN